MGARCPHCSFWADNFNPIIVHLNHRDATTVAISRAPQEQIAALWMKMPSALRAAFPSMAKSYFFAQGNRLHTSGEGLTLLCSTSQCCSTRPSMPNSWRVRPRVKFCPWHCSSGRSPSCGVALPVMNGNALRSQRSRPIGHLISFRQTQNAVLHDSHLRAEPLFCEWGCEQGDFPFQRHALTSHDQHWS
jgi:Bacterial protein of unknown function (DUF899)